MAVKMYVLKNVNKERNCFYQYPGSKMKDDQPYWLRHDYVLDVVGGGGVAELHRAHFYVDEKVALKQAINLTKKLGVGGSHFGPYRNRYPDSCGEEGYVKYAPMYEVVAVMVDVREVDDEVIA